MPKAHLPKFKKSELEEGGGALCVEGNILDVDVAFGLRKSPKRPGPDRVGFSDPDDIVNGSNGSAKERGRKENDLDGRHYCKYKPSKNLRPLVQGQ